MRVHRRDVKQNPPVEELPLWTCDASGCVKEMKTAVPRFNKVPSCLLLLYLASSRVGHQLITSDIVVYLPPLSFPQVLDANWRWLHNGPDKQLELHAVNQ